jgi:dTDP-4-dehydrorhamnose reductase
MKILILGYKGMLGSDLMQRLGGRHEVIGRDIDEIDITLESSCREVFSDVMPEIVVNAAAYTDVDGCESNRERCFTVNAEGVRNICLASGQIGARVVHYSTDYVFDGTKGEPYLEDDRTNPLSAYGESKLAGELYLRQYAGDFTLIRTEWLYGRNGKNFVKTILAKANEENHLKVVDDQIGSPTFTWDLAGATRLLIEGNHKGVFHVTNRGSCSWYEFACEILASKGIKDVTVAPISSDQLKRPARRPAYSVLSCRRFIETTGKTMRFWKLALQEYLLR